MKKFLSLMFALLIVVSLAACGGTEQDIPSNTPPADTAGREDAVQSGTESFAPIAGDYSFASGAGGWSTDITVNADGTFSGTYHDTDFSDGSEEYGSVCELSEFHGSFVDLRKVDDYTYSFEMGSLVYDSETGKEEIAEQDGETVKFVYTTAYGLENGKTFYFYAEGAPSDSLPEAFVDWVAWVTASLDPATEFDTLPFNGLYNENEGYGFFAS